MGFVAAASSLLLLAVGAPGASAVTLGPVSLPGDEAPHRDASMEWWYFTGHLQGKDIFGKSHEYGFEMTMIRMDALGTEPVTAIWNGHLAISDITRQTLKQDEATYALLPDVVPAGGGFNNTVGLYHMDGKNGVNHLSGGFADLSYAGINLTLRQTQPAALHGNAGVIPYGPFGQSGYYSQTNLKASGTLLDHGVPVNVTGTAWQDHQWGDFTAGPGGWEWFSIQLDDNTQYMLYFIHNANNQLVETVGTRVNADGTTTNLAPGTISSTPLGSWTSPHTGITYQQKWSINVPGGSLTITPQLADQELYNPLVPQGSYWEGTSTVTGTINGANITGKAYAELTPSITLPTRGSVWQGILDALNL
ncbi:lipocalin family protein [Frankia sp. Mgl5]|uniref:lipocalin family protein n=1 Tax=Frankia sp. Mgl5 TaxID=2933793 RepID=UPI0027E4EA2D|nr:lipocalin family protein [Frankia sp. Mgl5]